MTQRNTLAVRRHSIFAFFAVVALFAASAFAQDTAYIPFTFNVDVTVKAQQDEKTFSKDFLANVPDTLVLVSGVPEVSSALASPGRTQKPATMYGSRGKLSLELSPEFYRNAEISLYSLNGKRVLHNRVSASEAARNISHPNIATGVYVLYVKGGGNTFSTRLAHHGGGMNIDVAFGSVSPLRKDDAGGFGIWTITISSEGHLDFTYTLPVRMGENSPQNIISRDNSFSFSSVDEPSSSSADSTPSSSSVETPTSSSSVETPTSSSSVGGTPSSSSVNADPSSTSSVEISSSSSVGSTPSSSSAETPTSSSSVGGTPSSSSVDNGNSSSSHFTFDDIKYWVGEGNKRAMLIVQWNDGKSPEALAYGYKWSGEKSGYDIVADIAKADGKLFFLKHYSPYLGNAIAGFGFDSSGSDNAKLSDNGGTSCVSPVNGSMDTHSYDFDNWKLCDGNNASTRWQAGWMDAYWSYWVTDIAGGKWEYSNLGASSRVLENNSVDAWYFDINLNDIELSTFYRCMEAGEDCDGRDYFGKITPASGSASPPSSSSVDEPSSSSDDPSSSSVDDTSSSSSDNDGDSSSSVELLKCSEIEYNAETQFCHEATSKVGQYCGDRTDIYNPELYECKPTINPNGIYLKQKPVDDDGNEYEAVLIGKQVWMAENINYGVETYSREVKRLANQQLRTVIGNSACHSNLKSNCDKYGRLYSFDAALEKACPSGWHLPTDAEWTELTKAVGGTGANNLVGAVLPLKAKSGWKEISASAEEGTDDYGFAALPGRYGNRNSTNGNIEFPLNYSGLWWSATPYSSNGAWTRSMGPSLKDVSRVDNDEQRLYSVRCVKGLPLCGAVEYDHKTNFCQNLTNVVKPLCDGKTYQSSQFCQEGTNEVKSLCNGKTYPETQFCRDGQLVHIGCKDFTDGTETVHQGKSKKQFCDPRDGTKYVYVDIGSQTWMAENLNYSGENGTMGKCAKGEPENCNIYGKLYTLDEMFCKDGCEYLQGGVANPNDHSINIACPVGWHLPSNTEVEDLLSYSDPDFVPGNDVSGTGSKNSAAAKLKVTSWGTSTDELGFSALPGGYCGSSCPNISNITGLGTMSFWWSHAYGAPVPLVKTWRMTTSDKVDDAFQSLSDSRFYTRCLKDKSQNQSPKIPEPAPQPIDCIDSGTEWQQCHYGQQKDYFTDLRDGKEYPYVKIGEKVWMAANLNYNASGSKCYNDLDANCNIYGRLYNFATAGNACPSGWHLPTDAEWTALTTAVNNGLAGTATKLKAKSGWSNSKSGNGTYGIDGTDDFGFTALPGSYGNLSTGNYDGLEGSAINFGSARAGFWWSATTAGAGVNGAQIRHIGPTSNDVTKAGNDVSRLYSVRCVSDQTSFLSSCNMAKAGEEGTAIALPVLTCNDGSPSAIEWSGSPNWSNPEAGEYEVFARAKCGEHGLLQTISCGKLVVEEKPPVPQGPKCGETEYDPETHFCDARDNKVYKFVEIGNQIWMAENLNYAVEGSLCYNNDEILCETYGRLYKKEIANNACPSDWHLPRLAEWETLLKFVDGNTGTGGSTNPYKSPAGKQLKAATVWNESSNGNGTDTYGFSALPGGESYGSDDYSSLNTIGYWWTSTTQSIYYLIAKMRYNSDIAETMYEDYNQHLHISVRCVKD